jgi:acyl dehydratase
MMSFCSHSGGLCRLRKHRSNRPGSAGKSSYFCNASVIWVEQPRPDWDTSGVTDRALRYFDDYPPGVRIDCGSVSVSEAEILSFAAEFDPQPFHVDPAAAARGPFGGLVASGWHTAALVMRQFVDYYLPAEASLGSPGLDEIRWPEPVRPGDTLRVHATALEARRSQSKPDRGILKTAIEAVNQDGRTVMRATATNFLRVRPNPGS